MSTTTELEIVPKHPGLQAAITPDKPAIIMGGTGAVVTFAEFEARSNQIAHLLRQQGLKPGDGVVIYMHNVPEYLQIVWGANRAGLRFTAISYHLNAEEAAYIINDCGAKVVFAEPQLAEHAVQLPGMSEKVTAFYSVGGEIDGYASFEDGIAGQPDTPAPNEQEGIDMLYSSGTTGRPKGIVKELSGEPLGIANKAAYVRSGIYNFDNETVYLNPAPLYHTAPLIYSMNIVRWGGTLVVMERFDAEQSLQLIEKHQVTHSQWVPTMFVRLLRLPEDVRAKYDHSSLKYAIHAAAPCPIPIKKQMMDWWGPIIYEYYGGTEGNGYVAITPEEWLEHPGSVGTPSMGILHIVGDDGVELPTGETGTIYFEGGPTFAYHGDEEKTASSRLPNGWSTLGDVGYMDKDGYLYLTDRKSYMIISGGVNIYPQEIENLLVTHPKVIDAAVFGVPNEEFGEEVKAVVQPLDPDYNEASLAEELTAFCRKNLSSVKCPRSFDFMMDLPRHENGKLFKRLLKDQYWKDARP